MMKVEIISRETIKPSSPTSPHLKKMPLSLLDQLAPSSYVPLVLFFPPPPLTDDDHVKKFTEMSQCLRKSLSETLTLFFRIAGRSEDNVSIDCNDKGVEYFEARVDCLLDDVLENPENDVLKGLVAVVDNNNITCAAVERCQLLVQINFFNCGGIAIGVSFCHKVFDMPALITFLEAWSAVALNTQAKEKSVVVVPPDFTTLALAFPAVKEIPTSWDNLLKPLGKNIIKNLVFDASKIAELRSNAANACGAVIKPTRVEVVSALIWKCTMKAGRKMMSGSARKPYVVGSAMNLRKRLVPPLPENSMGNLTWMYTAQLDASDDQTDLGTLVNLLRKELIEACNFTKMLGGEYGNAGIFELFKKLENKMKTCRFLTFSSWCKFPFYEVDFGWGKPTWVGFATVQHGDFVILIDSKDGVGVEAFVSLCPEEMAVFECDPELLAFALVKGNV